VGDVEGDIVKASTKGPEVDVGTDVERVDAGGDGASPADEG